MPGEAWYDGAHSITFGDWAGRANKNTWTDWHLIPTSRPAVASPPVNTRFVDIPGRDGSIDMSTYLTGGLTYGNRTGSWEFIVDNGWEDWETIRSNIVNYLHGPELYVSGHLMRAILQDDPTRYWLGQFSVDGWRSEAVNSKITISYVLKPFSYSM